MKEDRKAEAMALMPRMATLKEASEITPFTYYALRKMCLENRVANIRNSGKIYINLDSLARLMNGGNSEHKLF